MSSPAETPPIIGDVGAGHTLGRYELLIPIATGGMAMVWAARLKGSRGFQKIVAVKTMLPKLSEDPQFERMFLDEASLASLVRHPNVVEIMDLGEQDGVLFLVMEWIEGVPLSTLIKTARLSGSGVPLNVAVRIAMQACAGLHAAHELCDAQGQHVGLVHRDVSPQNVLVTYAGVTKVVDFGVAKANAAGGFATGSGQIKGKLAYMAPEQVIGEDVDRRADVFALGIVLYTMTTGKHPFRKENDAATLHRICSPEPAISPRKVLPGYPLQLERVVLTALAKDPAKRYQTANDMLVALDQSLPASMRAASDEPVAKFIRDLFGESRDKQKLQLQAALERADRRAQEGASLKDFLDANPPPSRASRSGVSGVSGVSSVSTGTTGEFSAVTGVPISGTPGIEAVPGMMSPLSSGSVVTQVAPIMYPPPKSRSGLVAVLVLLLLAAGGAAGFVLYQQKLANERAAQAAAVPPPPPKVVEVVPAPTPEPPTPPPSASAIEPAAATAARPPRTAGRSVAKPVPAAAAAAAATTASKPAEKPKGKGELSVDKVFQ